MGDRSTIEWTDASWNPVTGCSKVSPGCANCYAESFTRRMAKVWGVPDLAWTPANAAENVILHPERLAIPLRWRRPRMIFVNSMSDLFHEEIPDDYIARVFAVMAAASQHTFQVLTKRPERMRDLLTRWSAQHKWRIYSAASAGRRGALSRGGYVDDVIAKQTARGEAGPLPNVWLGTSIENRRFVHRADLLRDTPAAVRFISAEPLLGPLIALDLTGIDWLIVGGESGQRHRPVDAEWVRALRDAARITGTAFFFKQWGGRTPKAGGRLLDERTWDEFPRVAEQMST